MAVGLPVIPETITVHLGAPDEPAQNVTLPFMDYIMNVASSEIYPTWPEEAIRANIYAQISYALNRVYTEYYRSRGYDFDITNSTRYDQYFVNGREIFENIQRIVGEIFNDYIRRQGTIEPLFAQYCNGTTVTCDGLSQWGSVSLAQAGFTPYRIIDAVSRYTAPDTPVATDVGQHQMWVAQRYPFEAPRTFVTSGGLGTMGFGLGAAIGAAVGTEKRTVLFTGDGSFGMNLNEMATAVSQKVPVVVMVMNNGVLGMVRQWQTMFYDKHYSETTLNRKTDFVKLAEAFGAVGFRATNEEELEQALTAAFTIDGPVLIDCIIDCDERVLPMIPPGGTVNDLVIK